MCVWGGAAPRPGRREPVRSEDAFTSSFVRPDDRARLTERRQTVGKTWKAGVIGCGSVAQDLHLPGYVRAPGIGLVSACDPARARHKEAQRIQKGLRTYLDYRKMLDEEERRTDSPAANYRQAHQSPRPTQAPPRPRGRKHRRQ